MKKHFFPIVLGALEFFTVLKLADYALTLYCRYPLWAGEGWSPLDHWSIYLMMLLMMGGLCVFLVWNATRGRVPPVMLKVLSGIDLLILAPTVYALCRLDVLGYDLFAVPAVWGTEALILAIVLGCRIACIVYMVRKSR